MKVSIIKDRAARTFFVLVFLFIYISPISDQPNDNHPSFIIKINYHTIVTNAISMRSILEIHYSFCVVFRIRQRGIVV